MPQTNDLNQMLDEIRKQRRAQLDSILRQPQMAPSGQLAPMQSGASRGGSGLSGLVGAGEAIGQVGLATGLLAPAAGAAAGAGGLAALLALL